MPNTKTRKTSNAGEDAGMRNEGTPNSSKLQEFFVDQLKDIYWAEKHLTKALQKMQKAATTEELQTAFADHLTQTEGHISRLEQVFEGMGEKPQAKKCEAMEGLIKEGESIVEETDAGSVTRDAALIMAAQKVEHYEIATYGGLVQLAKTVGLEDAAQILAQTLQEEKDTDSLLSDIAENSVNWEAATEDEEKTSEEE